MATDVAFTVKVDDRTFTLDRITLGDWRMFRTEFGLKASDITTTVQNPETGESTEILNLDDPNVLIGLMVAALHHERPHAPIADLVAEVEALGMEGLQLFPDQGDAEESEESPLDDGSEAAESPASSGKSAKPRKKPGTPR